MLVFKFIPSIHAMMQRNCIVLMPFSFAGIADIQSAVFLFDEDLECELGFLDTEGTLLR